MLAAEMAESVSAAPEGLVPYFSKEFGKSGAEWSLVGWYNLPREIITNSNEGDRISSTFGGSALLAGHATAFEYKFHRP